MSNDPEPPAWAEFLLGLSAPRDNGDSIAGDLLEEYRDRTGGPGRRHADLWYVTQVGLLVWHGTWAWGVLHGLLFSTRTAADWLAPPSDFVTRSTISTATAALVFLGAGFWAGRRVRTAESGALAGLATGAIGAVVSGLATTILLALFHDAPTLAAIAASGGLAEVYTLPVLIIVPGTVLGTLGGIVGALTRRLLPRSS
jgi:hypothetical protein